MITNDSFTSLKRKYPRRYFRSSVGVLYRGQYTITKGIALGEGGMAFVWPIEIPIDFGAVVTFKIPGDAMISILSDIKNAIIWDEDPNYFFVGIQFRPLPISEKRRIRAYVSSRADNEPLI